MDMTISEQREWVLQRENFSLIRQCKKLIQDEFSCHISLGQEDLLEVIVDYSRRSRNHQLIVLSRPIVMIFHHDSTNYYRGQPVSIARQSNANNDIKAKVIYRGQKIAV